MMRIFLLFLASLLLAANVIDASNFPPLISPRPLPALTPGPGVLCSTSGTRGVPPKTCDNGGICVLTDFGNPPVDIPDSGICRKLRKFTPKCSVNYCSANGPYAVCRVSNQYAFCSAWGTRRDGGPKPQCPEFCTEECRIPKLRASDGSTYCNECKLISASCSNGFSFFGPVDAPASCFDGSILGLDQCCRKYRVACIPPAKQCSTTGSLIPPVPCVKSTTCVVTDFGFPAVDQPTEGHCRWVYRVPKCTLKRCVKNGASFICKIDNTIATCGAWATREDGGMKPNCPEICPKFCLPEKLRLLGSNGVRYCNYCELSAASCQSDFTIYGPVKRD